jgi:hypothetical protein
MRKKEEIPVLVAEIKNELQKLEILTEKISSQVSRINDQEIAESAALRLHNFYSGCERIFRLIASEVNGGVPQDLDWHKRLLTQVGLEIEMIRPPVISPQTRKDLEELLKFRHIVRNLYGFELEPKRIKPLISLTTSLYPRLADEIEKFIAFLMGVYNATS